MRRLFIWLMIAFVGVLLVSTLTRSLVLSHSLRQLQQGSVLNESQADARIIAQWVGDRWDRTPADLRVSLGALARVAEARVWLVDLTGQVLVDGHVEAITLFARQLGQGFNRWCTVTGGVEQ